jgi:release factor glutamine methyltransferase
MESPRLEAELLLAHVLSTDRVRLIVEPDRPLETDELRRYKDFIMRRRRGEPVAYIRGEKEFYGRMFHVDARVLVPRPDTETLVETALRRATVKVGGRYLDLCTGSGCVAITLARERPTCQVFAVDLSPDALTVARENAVRLGAVQRVAWLEGDLFEALDALEDGARGRDGARGGDGATGEDKALGKSPRFARRLDLITANPPYIPREEVARLAADIRDFEPKLALLGGDDGLDVTRRIIAGAPAWLKAGGVLAVEIDSAQAPEVARLFGDAGFSGVMVDKDYGARDRVISGTAP